VESAKARGLSNVKFYGSVPKDVLSDFINAADACTAVLKPSFRASYPRKVFDYMALAKPIILPVDGACRELVVGEAKAGLYVEPGDAEGFRRLVLRLRDNPDEAAKLGGGGYDFVKQNFDRRVLAKKYLEAIEEKAGLSRTRADL